MSPFPAFPVPVMKRWSDVRANITCCNLSPLSSVITFLPLCPSMDAADATDTLPWLVNITTTWSSATSPCFMFVDNMAVTFWLRFANVFNRLVAGTPIVFSSDCGIAFALSFWTRPRSEKNNI